MKVLEGVQKQTEERGKFTLEKLQFKEGRITNPWLSFLEILTIITAKKKKNQHYDTEKSSKLGKNCKFKGDILEERKLQKWVKHKI